MAIFQICCDYDSENTMHTNQVTYKIRAFQNVVLCSAAINAPLFVGNITLGRGVDIKRIENEIARLLSKTGSFLKYKPAEIRY